MQGVYSFAEVNFLVEYKYRYTEELFKPYKVSENPSATITLTDSDYEFERQRSSAPIEYLENLAILRKIIVILLTEHKAVLFHGSAIKCGENGFLFTAPSGTGKSTHTRLLKEYLGEKVSYINDDKPILKVGSNGVTIYGSAWNGKHWLGENTSAPLKAICVIKRAENNSIEKLDKALAVRTLLEQTVGYANKEQAIKLLEVISGIVDSVDFYTLYCNKDISAAKTSHEGMILNYEN